MLYICDEYPPGKTGGIGTVVSGLARELASKGHRIFVVGLYPPGYGGLDKEVNGNITVRRFRYLCDIGWISDRNTLWDKILLHGLRFSGIMALDAHLRLRKMQRYIRELILRESIDLIEIPDWNNCYFNAKLKSLRFPNPGIPIIVKFHGTLSYFNREQGFGTVSRLFKKENYIIHRATAHCAVSNHTARICKDIYQLKGDVVTLYNSVSLQQYIGSAQRSNTNRVIFTGSLFAKKGIYSLMKAWSWVKAKVPNASLHVFGKGDVSAAKSFLDPEITPSVVFYGHIDRERLLEELNRADVAVFPSYSETFGLGAVEAMATGCPVVYTKRSCGPEIIAHEKEGLLVEPDEPLQIAEAIITLLLNPELRDMLGRAGYEKVSTHFDRRKNTETQLKYYENVVSEYNKINQRLSGGS